MTPSTSEALRSLARVHGVIAWAAAAALVVALALAFARRAAGRGVVAATAAAAALLTGAGAAGLGLDLPYRGRLRQRIFLEAPALGWMFERKLHLAFGAAALAWCALALLAAAALERRRAGGPGGPSRAMAPWVRDLERGGRAALAASAVFALAAALLSAVVARRYAF